MPDNTGIRSAIALQILEEMYTRDSPSQAADREIDWTFNTEPVPELISSETDDHMLDANSYRVTTGLEQDRLDRQQNVWYDVISTPPIPYRRSSTEALRTYQTEINRLASEIARTQAIMGTSNIKVSWDETVKPPMTKLEQEIHDLETMGYR